MFCITIYLKKKKEMVFIESKRVPGPLSTA